MYGAYGAVIPLRPGVNVVGGSGTYQPEPILLTYDRSDNKRNCIRQGAEGNDASSLSWLLAKAGYLSERDYWDAEDSFTSAMRTALIAFQRANGLSADGIAGPNTWAKLGDVGLSCGSSGSREGSLTPSGGSSGGSSLGISSATPFYRKTWFYWTVGGLTAVALAAILLTPKKKGKR